MAAKIMSEESRILIDRARRRKARIHGRDWLRVPLGDHANPFGVDAGQLMDLYEALERLTKDDPEEAELAKLRLVCGLTVPEVAEALNTSTATVKRRWRYIKARLSLDLKRGDTKS